MRPPCARTNHWVLNLTVDGCGRVNSGADMFHAEVGDVLLFPPNQPHDYSWEASRGHWTHLWVYFSPMAHWAPLLNWPRKAGHVMGFSLDDTAVRDRVRTAMERALEFFRSPLKNRLQFCANALEEALLWCDTANPFAHGSGSDDRVRTAVAFMMKNFAQPMSVERIAQECSRLRVPLRSPVPGEHRGVPVPLPRVAAHLEGPGAAHRHGQVGEGDQPGGRLRRSPVFLAACSGAS